MASRRTPSLHEWQPPSRRDARRGTMRRWLPPPTIRNSSLVYQKLLTIEIQPLNRPLARARQASALTHTDGAGGGVASPCVGLPSGSAETSPTVAVRRQRERRRPWLSSAGPCNRQVTHDRCGRHRGRHGRHGPCADRLRRRVADRSEATQRPEGSTPLTTETQLQVAAQLSISVSVLVRCPAMHNFRSLRQMMVQRRRRNHASSLRLTGHHAAWRAGFIHASLQTVAS